MKRTLGRLGVSTLCATLAVAVVAAQKPLGQRLAEQIQTEQYLRTRDQISPSQQELRRQAEWIESDLVRKANKFALLWAQFVVEENGKHTVDVKLAKKLEKAFSDLQKAPGWPANKN